jgi:subtilisin family serine protease
LAFVFLAIFYSCEEIPLIPNEQHTFQVNESSKDSDPHLREGEIIVPNQVVVKFNDLERKKELRNQFQHFITEIDSCSCGNLEYELWTIDETLIDVEGAIGEVTNNSGGGVEGENQFIFSLPPGWGYTEPIPTENRDSAISNLIINSTNTNPRVNVAVIDTGIDLKRNSGAAPFLYNTEGIFECPNQQTGWNFVEDNSDISASVDHGSFVTGIITSRLMESASTQNGVDYSILPVKAFDETGRSSYWDMVCSFAYINEIQKLRKDIHIINASFGYDFEHIKDTTVRNNVKSRQKMLSDILYEMKNDVVIVTSSGNENYNNNEVAHYPSGFNNSIISFQTGAEKDTLNHIVGVGGWEYQQGLLPVNVANYGNATIDLGAKYHGHEISFNYEDIISGIRVMVNEQGEASGTSYGTALVTALLAREIKNTANGNVIPHEIPSQTIMEFFDNTNLVLKHPNLEGFFDEGKYVK